MIESICAEINLNHEYLETKELDSVYFGGGTPSVLSGEELHQIFEAINKHFSIKADAEITLEANPDDLNEAKLQVLADSPVNRLSIGLQSFDEEDLKLMNRSHTAEQSKLCVKRAKDFGFDDVSIDLIYGVPDRTEEHWEQQLAQALALEVNHISAYALTIEKETMLENWIRNGKVKPVDERMAERNFYFLEKILKSAGYEHYEISNFAKPGHRAKHNSSYWDAQPYLGIGPSAHSYNGDSRQWNVANNHLYMASIADGELSFQKEVLSIADVFNETIMTGLRRSEGVSVDNIDEKFGVEFSKHLMKEADSLKREGKLIQEQGRLYIPDVQRFFSDGIAASLFYV